MVLPRFLIAGLAVRRMCLPTQVFGVLHAVLVDATCVSLTCYELQQEQNWTYCGCGTAKTECSLCWPKGCPGVFTWNLSFDYSANFPGFESAHGRLPILERSLEHSFQVHARLFETKGLYGCSCGPGWRLLWALPDFSIPAFSHFQPLAR